MRFSLLSAVAVTTFAIAAVADKAKISKLCPFQEICYQLNVPNNTAATGQGDIFFQINASSTYQWVAMGLGSQMLGANIFVVYQAANGKDVTVSPRLGVGHEEPLWDSRADIEVLDGSGVKDGRMVANIRCGDCDKWAGGAKNFTDDTADWIFAMKEGSPLRSNDKEATIREHDQHKDVTWPLRNAKGGDSTNPFLDSAVVHDTSNASADSDSDSWVQDHLTRIHGGLATLAFVILFPIGGILIRLANFRGGMWIHVGLQIIAWVIALGAVASGIRLARTLKLYVNAHPIIGMVLAVLLLGQPAYGIIHHRKFQQIGQRTAWSYAHLTIGRIAVFGGMINGGLGIMLAGDVPQKGKIAYAVIAVVLAVLYIAAIVWGERRRKNTKLGATGFRQNEDKARLISRGDDQGLAEPQGQEMRPLWLADKRGHNRSSTEYAPLAVGEGYGVDERSRSMSRAPSPSPDGRYNDRRSLSVDARARTSMA